ncbi:two pore potassium channel protein sup-9-like [Ruditapes philippinarum]|uniref:two pore potassium channel protein sup-9-like n=1 Tax=Ruditapes philippinarum TaxID=129788 RepID=UPI00295B8F84|nr:two pore potassium channel protein sup-9-like [Ruditapes philippinarum]
MKSKIMKRQNVRTLSLIVCTFTYLLVGAALFDALESRYEVERRADLLEDEMMFRNKYNMTPTDFEILRKNVERTVPYYSGIQWKFSGSFYFALTVVTVIGYGHSTPQTVGGKIFCMFYAVAGIPLCIIMFQSVGERLNVFITYTLKKIRKCLKLRNRTVPETHVILVTMNLSTLVLTSGALMFDHYEHWGFLDSLYYCFITLTTIGFGDYVALQKDDALQEKLHYVVFSLIFILFGLTVISAAMNLLVLRFLTMNTEDERRDELEAAAAAQNAIHLDGDVITSNGNVHVVSNAQERAAVEYSEVISVCSCSCYKWSSNRGKEVQNNRRRNQSIFTTTSGKNNYGRDDSSEEGDSFLQYHSKRNSL